MEGFLIVRITTRFGAAWAGAAVATMAISPIVAAATTIVVTPINQQGWSTADTRPPGTVEFVADGSPPGGGNGALELRTVSADLVTAVSAKAQYLHPANTPLADITELDYWTKQVAAPFAGADPSYQLVTCLTGAPTTGPPPTCPGFTTFVFEPYQGGLPQPVVPGVWQQWDVDQGLFWSTRTVTCSNGTILGSPGGPATYTLAQIKATCPAAVVGGFGVNIGTNNPDYIVRTDLFNFNGTTYDFELFREPSSRDDCKNGGWREMARADGTPFKNQGECVSYVNHREEGGGTGETATTSRASDAVTLAESSAGSLGSSEFGDFSASRLQLSLLR
jgi:hypothetical protein